MAIQKLPAVASDPAVSKLIDLDGVRVLVVDDDPEACQLTGAVIERAGGAVATAEGAEAALHLVHRWSPAVIVSDVEMPECDGYHLMRRLRARRAAEGGTTPAIALTGHSRPQDHTRALLAGFQLHLAKPVKSSELVVAIASLVRR